MKLRAAVPLLCAIVAGACATGATPDAPRLPGGPAPASIRVKLGSGQIRTVPLEEYVRGAVLSELVPGREDRTIADRLFEVQAIVARTFALSHLGRHRREGHDLCSTTHCQLYEPERLKTSSWARAAAAATARTSGRVLSFEGRTASALFHADCGGHTSGAAEVWGGSGSPYLIPVADLGPAADVHSRWTFEIDTPRLLRALNADPRTSVGPALSEVRVLERDRGGRAVLVLLRGSREPVVRGEELRGVLTRSFGARAIRSTRFDVRRSGSAFLFTGQGFGHGVGLCQAGARARIRAGATAEQVLALYYPGTRLQRRR